MATLQISTPKPGVVGTPPAVPTTHLSDLDLNLETASLLSHPLLHTRSEFTSSYLTQTMGSHTHKIKIGKQGAIVLLCCINLLNYIDRGIIPGAPEKFNHFITETLGVSVLHQSVYFGLLTSAFIATYSVFSIVFGYLALTHRPFRIIALGMTVWSGAVIICGAAQATESYYVLIIGRLISGVGEASFQCTATPFINRYAPPAKRSLYLGVYLASITVGTALGYIYGSIFASSALGWAAAYYVEAVVMAGFVVCCLTIIPDELNQIPVKEVERFEVESKPSAVVPSTPEDEDKTALTAYMEDNERKVPVENTSFCVESWAICSCIPFMLVTLGQAAYTFSLAAMSTYSPAIFIGIGLFESETIVSLVFGGLVAITGTIGTPVGGLLVDHLAKKKPEEIGRRCMISVKALFYFMLASIVFGLLMVVFISTRILCLIFLTLCLFCMCVLSVPATIAVLELFPKYRQSMAVATNTLLIHALGDVPSPIILGYIKDEWAPLCGTVEINGKAQLNPRCPENHSGLRDVLLFAVVWLAWGTMLWGATILVVKRKLQDEKRRVGRSGIISGSA
uniref:Major facilitator superfamily (MFS) profile domain-containing protein n=2 Tax=Hyaloperonospora arabidopsidis (strain Emoy2) TaxID=559515 RepID=M4BYQ1_HYAAE